MDGEIGKAAGETPSRRDGKTMIDDLTKQLVELFQRAVDGLRSMFGRTCRRLQPSRPVTLALTGAVRSMP